VQVKNQGMNSERDVGRSLADTDENGCDPRLSGPICSTAKRRLRLDARVAVLRDPTIAAGIGHKV